MTNKRLSFGFLTVLAAAITGCSLDVPLQGTPCPSDAEAEAGARLEYISLEDGSKCTRDRCLSEKDCCGLSGSLAKSAWQTFHYNRCATGTPFFNCMQINEKEFFCGPVKEMLTLKCDPGTHPNSTNIYCENDTVDACGSVSTTCRVTGTNTVYCVWDDADEKAKCVASDCDDHYHLKDGKCVADTATECGASMENCTLNELSGLTVCSNGRCDSRCSGYEENCQGNCLIFENIHIDSCENNIPVCAEGYVNWDDDVTNGCETSLASIHVKYYDAVNDRIECVDNYADCDGVHHAADVEIEGVVQNLANGCEVNLMSSNTHCGRCATIDQDTGLEIAICDPEHVCQDGICVRNNCLGDSVETGTPDMCKVFVPELDEEDQPVYDENGNPVGSYENQCFNVHGDDPDRCGACDYKCSAYPLTHATSGQCEAGVCQYVCESGYTNCSDSRTDVGINCISDAAMQQDSNNCGECGKVCGVNDNGEKTVCVGGVCVVNSCTNENETPCQEGSGMVCHDLNSTDVNNCGGCGYICGNNPTSTASSNECKAGACLYTCNAGYTQCSGNDDVNRTMDKIICVKTSDMQTDPNNCGGCNIQCNSDESCVGGSCQKNTCDEGYTFCGMNDCRLTTGNDPVNCGACNNRCENNSTSTATSTSCLDGVCQFECKSGYENCGTGETSGTISCVLISSMQMDNNNCGGCGDTLTGEHICASDESCVSGQCVKNDCGSGLTMCGLGECRQTKGSDANNCGACGFICANNPTSTATSDTCLGGVCQYTCKPEYTNCGTGVTAESISCVLTTSMQTDNYNCGGCGNPVTGEHICKSTESCVNGKCEVNDCGDGQTLCGLGVCKVTNGDDADNCGSCGYVCSEHSTSFAESNSCSGGVCQYSCKNGYTKCGTGTTAASIVCVKTSDMQMDNNNCGGCGIKCQSYESCVAGECQANDCSDGKTLCALGDCRTINGVDASNCGTCGYICSNNPTTTATSDTCVGGVCQYTCKPEYTNCGTGVTSDSISCVLTSSMQTDSYNCGGCGDPATGEHICSPTESCVKGKCETNDCGEGQTLCGLGVCKVTNGDDAENCGSCGYICSDHPTTVARSESCSGGKCQYVCKSEYTKCGGGSTADGIVCVKTSDMQTDPNNCGGCGNSVTGDHICQPNESCVAGNCEVNDCGEGQTLCGLGDCRTINGNDANNCGTCGYICSNNPTSTATSDTCLGGVCQYTCKPDYTKCSTGVTADSISCVLTSSMQTDNYNCGGCGNPVTGEHICKSTESCVKGECVTNDCGEGQTLCGLGICKVTNGDDAENCGSCGYICSEHPTTVARSESCSGGKCQYVCKSEYTNCGGGSTADGIVCVKTSDMQSDPNNCGGCGNPVTGEHICASTESCVKGECVTNDCGEGQTLCGLGDCRNINGNDANNCGTCGYVCSNNSTATATSNTCLGGVCQYTCKAEYTKCSTGVTADSISCVLTSSMQTDNYNCGGCGDPVTGDHICKSTESCVKGKCETNDCGDGQTLCGLGDCRATNGDDAENCGSCGYVCSEHPTTVARSESCSGGKCQYVCKSEYTFCGGGSTADGIVCVKTSDMQSDPNNCGGCGNSVTGEHVCKSTESCVKGECVTNDCGEGQTLCGLGDCRNINGNDANNCGTCGYVCSNNSTATATSNTCLGGVCQYTCKAEYTKCSTGVTADSISCVLTSSMQTDSNNCGGCGDPATGEHICSSTESCVKGECQKNDCDEGQTLCGLGDCRITNGNDANNCGSCGYACTEHPTTVARSESCSGGKCQYVCKNDYTYCGGGSTADGIVCVKTSDMQTDPNNCGGCGNSATGEHICNTNESCVRGICEVNDCDNGQTLCGLGVCRTVDGNDADNCGSCGFECAEHPISTATSNTCLGGVCQYVCKPEYETCSGGTTAESINCVLRSSLQTDPNNCGACGNKCNSNQSCVGGLCQDNTCTGGKILCGMGDCRTVDGNDEENCGACGYKCSENPITHATSDVCSNGICQYTCDEGYSQCSVGVTAASIICVKTSDMQLDPNNCGSCGHKCDPGESCVSGSCQANTCTGGQILCGMGDCRTVDGNDEDNCGACGYKCSEHPIGVATSNSCVNGVCQYTCPSLYENCGGSTESSVQCISVESMLSDNYHCGGCVKAGSDGEVCGSAESCINGECVTTGCPDNQTLCPETSGNNCRTLSSDPANCGYCGYVCSAQTGWASGANCNNSNCVATGCTTGYCVSNGKCVDGSSSTLTCGINGNACKNCTTTINNATSTYCDSGICKVTACTSNFHISSDRTSCEQDTPTSCGNARINCTIISHATNTTCSSGNCVVTECESGFHPSGNQCVEDSSTNCGGVNCGNSSVLSSLHASAAYCDGGICKPRICVTGYSLSSDGSSCKEDTDNDCGTHNLDCTGLWPNANQSYCSNGQCQKVCSEGYTEDSDGNCIQENSLVCPTGETNCGGAGVCINLSNSSTNCGRCGHVCANGTQCKLGRCECSGTNKVNCGTEDAPVCVSNSFTSTDHCNYCNNNCDSIKPAHTHVKNCSDRHCHFECDSEYANADPGNGDTADKIQCILKGTSTCCYDDGDGKCHDCTSTGQVCNGSTCVDSAASCTEPGSTLCNGGCYNVYTSDEHCGKCNNKCEGGTTCQNATCVCGEGKVKCEGMSECVGIEALNNNSAHCGACGNNCKSNELYPGWKDGTCVDGVCMAKTCAGENLCFDTDDGVLGLCVNGLNNPDKCGRDGSNCEACPGPVSGTGYGYCNNGECAIACTDGTVLSDDNKCISAYSGCDAGELFCGGECVPNNNSNCGACGHECKNSTSCSNGICVCGSGKENCGTYDEPNCINVKEGNISHCGACNYSCSSHVPGWNGGGCSSYTCIPSSCATNYCYADSTCYYGLTDNQHCGSGNNCTNCLTKYTDLNGVGYCNSGTCKLQCDTGYKLNNTNDGCVLITTGCFGGQTMCGETCYDLTKTTEHCGSCDNNCKDLTGWINPTCSESQCHADGCKVESGGCFDSTSQTCVDGNNDVLHCGKPGEDCQPCTSSDPNGFPYCDGGTCTTRCNDNYYWNGTKCVLHTTPTTCNNGETMCDGECFDTTNTTNHCGSCDNNCNDLTGWINPSCNDSQCQATSCDESSNGCFDKTSKTCVDGSNDVLRCGKPGETCQKCSTSDPHGFPYCVNGSCTTRCNNNYYWNGTVCEQVSTPTTCNNGETMCDGECFDTTNTTNHCGSCGTDCNDLTGWMNPSCNNSQCQATGCDESSNGCFDKTSKTCVDGSNDVLSCGKPGETCKKCSTSDPHGYAVCNNGTCGTACSDNYYWNGTECVLHTTPTTCNNGETMCDGECFDTTSTTNHCGSCDNNCYNLTGWEGVGCSSGHCTATSCTAASGGCFDSTSQACVDGRYDVNHCGKAGTECKPCATTDPNGYAVCNNGTCTTACLDNYYWNGHDCELVATPISCPEGQQDCNGDGVCEDLSDIEHCGSCNNDCTAMTGWSEGECNEGVCNVSACEDPYVVDHNRCFVTYVNMLEASGGTNTSVVASDICGGFKDPTVIPLTSKKLLAFDFDQAQNVNLDEKAQLILDKTDPLTIRIGNSSSVIGLYKTSSIISSYGSLSELSEVTCPTKAAEYTANSLRVGVNACTNLPVICLMGPSKKVYKFTIITNGNDALIYWLPQNQ